MVQMVGRWCLNAVSCIVYEKAFFMLHVTVVVHHAMMVFSPLEIVLDALKAFFMVAVMSEGYN